ncbi:hypothetical protein PV08_07573 [Exophiala spinifera]|uniref:Gag1-like clamp domain-containing protein n=1 Tax=Exophiala spinifera TaxID=91928 RepID=A0A0D2B776_9EURO|nr:uncharacterized protein PV08_07573 [Exophiala spinifera]KIW14788.1 hypothetical protein PV08_07573 [Exophiala spinifera]
MHPLETPETSPTPSSPRPSTDLGNPPHAAFLHNLTQRLRKGSNASSQSGGAGSGHEAPAQPAPLPDPVKKTEKTREVKKLLAAMIRDDWEYPSTAVKENNGILPYREPTGYRMREEWASDIEAEERKAAYANAHGQGQGHGSANGKGQQNKNTSNNSPYRFETPDAVGDMILERKRKRRKLIEEELRVNEGLRVWTNRRDAWTGAVKQRPREAVAKRKESGLDRQRPGHIFRRSSSMLSHCQSYDHGRNGTSTSTSSSSPLNPGSSPTKSSTVNGDGADANTSINAGAGKSTAVIEASSTDSENVVVVDTTALTSTNNGPPLLHHRQQRSTPSATTSASSETTTNDTSTLDGPWLPIFPPLLPSDHDILRDRIAPKAYATIYSKIVVQGLAPNVPIPLVHMIPALVEGWKAEGNWPPQPATVLAVDVKKGRRSSAFAKWRRDHAAALDTRAADGQMAQHERDDGKSRVRRSISMMKRVLGGSDARGGAGLDELGIEFREHQDDHDDQEEMEQNITLNKALVG